MSSALAISHDAKTPAKPVAKGSGKGSAKTPPNSPRVRIPRSPRGPRPSEIACIAHLDYGDENPITAVSFFLINHRTMVTNLPSSINPYTDRPMLLSERTLRFNLNLRMSPQPACFNVSVPGCYFIGRFMKGELIVFYSYIKTK